MFHLLAVVALCCADEGQDEQRFRDAIATYKQDEVAGLKAAIEKEKVNKTNVPKLRAQTVKRLQDQLKEMQKPGDVMPVLRHWRLRTGEVGVLHYGMGSSDDPKGSHKDWFKVLQVVDDATVIVETTCDSAAEYGVAVRFPAESLYITGIDASEMVDGRAYKFRQVFEVLKPMRYATVAGGTKTIPHVKVFSVQKLPDGRTP